MELEGVTQTYKGRPDGTTTLCSISEHGCTLSQTQTLLSDFGLQLVVGKHLKFLQEMP